MADAEWESVRLGDVATLDIEKVAVQPDGEYALVGVLIAGQGLFRRETICGRDTNYATLHRLRTGQLVMRKLTAWEGPITTVPPKFDGCYVSSEFPTFTLDASRLLPEYMRLICQRPEFHAEMRMRSTGTAERRNRLKPEDLLSIEIDLPNVEVQRGIVATVMPIEALIADLETESVMAERTRAAAREYLLEDLETVELDEVLEGIDGGLGSIPKGEDRPPREDEWGIVKVSAVRPGRFYSGEAKTLPPKVNVTDKVKIRQGDILLTRCSGSARFVGAVCRVPIDPRRLILTDFVLRLRFKDDVNPDFMVEALASRVVRDQIEGDIDRTTTLRSVSKTKLRSLDVPCPTPERQQEIASLLTALRDAEDRTAEELAAARSLRASVANALLSGETEVKALAEELERV